MQIRDRIKDFRRVPASALRPNPRNWRTHPARQRDALRGILAEVGYADALLARVLDDGSLELVDGHLRAETTPDAIVPVLVLDVTAAEADKILLTLDPLAALAETDQDRLADLIASTSFDSPQLTELVEGVIRDAAAAELELSDDAEPREVTIPESFQVVVECVDEADQQSVYERFRAEGYKCRVLSL
jgi:hypothetical protein